MIRSWLFVPGDDPRKIERSFGCGADALVFDWEDAVAPARKAAARASVAAALHGVGEFGGAVYVRVNHLDTPFFHDDLRALPLAAIAGVVLPKCCGRRDIGRVCAALREAEAAAGMSAGATGVVAIVTESARSVLALPEICEPQERLQGLVWGGEDLASDLGVIANRDEQRQYRAPFLLARNLMLMAAAASAAQAIDAVYTDYKDLAGLAAECKAGRADGFSAKAAIHPAQVPVIHEHFTPTAAELAWARKVEAALAGGGVASLDGNMIDIAHQRLARRLLGGGS